MKQIFSLFLLSILFLTACQKDDEVIIPSKPGPKDPIAVKDSGIFQLELGLQELHAEDSLDAYITVVNNQNQPVLQNKPIRIGKIGPQAYQWRSQEIVLDKGTYSMTQLVVKKENKALYATPLSNSRLAQNIQIGLPQHQLLTKEPTVFRPQLLITDEMVGPEDFGYSKTTFQRNGLLVNVQAAITIAGIVYDAPVLKFNLVSTFGNGETVTRTIERNSLEEEIRFSERAVKFELVGNIWNVPVKKVVTREEVAGGNRIILEGQKNRKWLQQEETYLEIMGNWQKQSLTMYQQQADGQLKEVNYYQKKPQSQDLQYIFSDKGIYQGSTLIGVDRIDPTNKRVGETRYELDGNGKVTHIIQTMYDRTTTSVIENGISTEGGVTDVYMVLDNGHTVHYAATFAGGNKVSYTAATSTGGQEGGKFQYDQMINPRFTNKLFPDMYLSHVSKNNVAGRNSGYSGAIPSSVPYKYEYEYNADGYPVVLYTYYKSYQDNTDMYRMKTVYTYSN
ncbi:hypothetical protein [Flavihumibacter sp. UBA7668]|uniref:hypothetical protein n=1 Tax=Flavihumibacter sp. UBA7668 TaxID=1946542 RepID=UPI0025BFE882|nr:hypothetical protein [Flavihumibacter sp. UBA7668]